MRIVSLLALIALASLIMTAAAVSAGEVVKIGIGTDPAIYENKVAWVGNDTDVHLYDLDTKQDRVITTSGASSVAICGNTMAWREGITGKPTISVYDIVSGKRVSITKHVDAYSKPSIFGNRMVWSADENVYICDTSSTEPTWIVKGGGPDIFGGKIAYEADDGENPQIFVYDIDTGKSEKASSGHGYLYGPHIYGDRIIWTNTYTGMGWIEMRVLSSSNQMMVTNDNGVNPDGSENGCDTGTHIDVYGERIVYAKTSSDSYGTEGVYVYDMPAAESTQIYESGKHFTQPAIYGDTVVWSVDEDGGIYVCDIGTGDEEDLFGRLYKIVSDLIG